MRRRRRGGNSPAAGGGLSGDERRWVTALAVALLARLLAIGGLFVTNLPKHDDQFVGATTGDEAYSDVARAAHPRHSAR